MKQYILGLMVILLFCQCTNRGDVQKQLDQIETQISTQPKQARSLLDSISPSDYATPDLQARYYLLHTYCDYKLMEEGTNDSLISIAEQYYSKHGTPHDQMLCLLLHGVILSNGNQGGEAMLKYKAAVVAGENCDDHFFLGQIYSFMTALCGSVFDSDGVRYATRALEEYKIHGDESYIRNAEINLGIAHMQQGHYQESIPILTSAMEEAIQQRDTMEIILSISMLAESEFYLENYDASLAHFKSVLDNYQGQGVRIYGHTALLYSLRHEADSALFYLKMAEKAVADTLANYRYYLITTAQVHNNLGNLAEAYEAQDRFISLQTKFYKGLLSQMVMREQRDFVEKQLTHTRQRNRDLIISLCIALMGILLGFLSFYLYSKQKKTELQLQEEKINLEEERAKRLLLEMELKRENQKSIIQALKQSNPVNRLRKSLSSMQAMREQDWKELYAIFNEMLPSFEQVLKSRYPLSESELQICMLLKLDFTPGDVAILTGKTKASISMMRIRLYNKYFQKEGSAKDFDEFLRTI